MEKDEQTPYYLIGDIGGTNVRLELRDSERKVVKSSLALTSSFSRMEEALSRFVEESNIEPGRILGCISMAGKITDNCVKVQANVYWPLANGNLIRDHLSKIP